MPTPTTDFILATRAVPTAIALEPALNALNSLMILTKKEYMPGAPDWVAAAAASLTPAQLHTHHLVFIGLYHALTIEGWHGANRPACVTPFWTSTSTIHPSNCRKKFPSPPRRSC